MAEKRIITRVQNKRDTEANWTTAGQNGFTPKPGEIIIYDMGDNPDRVKVGDGTTPVHLLPFSTPNKTSELTNDSGFITSSDIPEGAAASTTVPKGAGTASVGTELAFARGDHVHPAQTTVTGNAGTATKLATARTISLGTGAIGTTSFDGSANVTIPVTQLKEAYLGWGGKDITASFSALDAALIEDLSANRLAGLPASRIKFERSSDSGSTWTTYTGNAALVTTDGSASNSNTSSSQSISNWHRVTIDVDSKIYCELRKIAIYVSTSGAKESQCKLEWGDYSSDTVWTTEKTVRVEGWSGWNIINVDKTIGNSTYGNTRYVRLTFSQSGVNSNYSSDLKVTRIRFYSNTCWNQPSTLAKNGHVYSYDSSLNTTFPAKVTASSFSGPLDGTATKATQDGSGNIIVNTYATKTELSTGLSGKADSSHTHDYIPTSAKGANNGVAELDGNGKVPSSQLPSYVDDVIEGTYVSETSFKNSSGTTLTGETGKIYVDTTTNKTYRWSGTKYVEISASLALGTTSSTAYRGDYGNIAYTHSQSAHAPSNAEKNQNAFSNIAVSGQTTVAADSATDTLTLVAGDNVSITTDATNDKVTIATTGLATVAKTGSYNDLKDKPSSMTPTAHNQASNTINVMTGYSKPSSTSAIATTDTLNAAIGKLEKGLDSKSSTGHTHNVTHTPAGTVSSKSITPSGTVTSTFTGTASSHNHGFTGTKTTLGATFTPDGSIESTFAGRSHGHTFEGIAVTSGKPDTTNVTTIYSITGVGTLPSATLDKGSLPTATFSAGTLPSASSTAASLTSSIENQCLTLSFTPDTHSFSAGTLPSLTFNAGSLPSLTFDAGSLPTRSSAISMPNTNHTHSVTASGNVSNTTAGGSVTSTFTGSEESISIEYTPTGTIGDKSITPEGTVASTFEGTAAEHDHDFTGTPATLTTTGA